MSKSITVTEIRDGLREFLESIEIHNKFAESARIEGHLHEGGTWSDRNAFETHLQMTDEIGEHISVCDYMDNEFNEWLESITTKIDFTKKDVCYFTELINRLNSAIKQGYGDKVITLKPPYQSLNP